MAQINHYNWPQPQVEALADGVWATYKLTALYLLMCLLQP